MRHYWITFSVTLIVATTSVARTVRDDADLTTTLPSEWTPEMLQRYRHSARYKAWLGAMKFFLRAQSDHLIPAYSAEEGSRFDTDLGQLVDFSTVSFPVSFTFRVTRRDDPVLYCYTVTRESRFAQWHFQEAWKQTKKGRRIAPLPF